MSQEIDIPLKIEPCPLVEAIVDFRFKTTIPSDAIFGIIYSFFQKDFSKDIEKLPVLQIPEHIRIHDKNLMYQPNYRLKDKDFLMQIGPMNISFVNINIYMGWEIFYERIKSYILRIQELKNQLTFTRLGLRYVNFFNFDIYNRINLSVFMGEKPFENKHLSLRAVLNNDPYQTNLNIINNTSFIKNQILQTGSIIDIDTYLEADSINIFTNHDELIGDAHFEEKKLFFKLLKTDFIEELHPTYGEKP